MKFSYNFSLVNEKELDQLIQNLSPYRTQLAAIGQQSDYAQPESSIQLPGDKALLTQMNKAAKRLRSNTLQYVIVIGIGGSNLGTQAVYEAVAGSMNLLVDRLPKLLFLDTVTDEKMTAVTRVLERLSSSKDFLAITITKSGSTTEVIANTEFLWNFATEQFGNVNDRFVVITDEGSKLWELSTKKKLECFAVPTQVGGRFSVFSAVGLLPLALAGIDITELLSGAALAVSDGVSPDLKKNHSLISACLTYFHTTRGRSIHNTFLFSPRYEGLGKWYRQLMAESLGKDGKGITPIVSIGSTDLHSMAQLYWGGPDDKFTNLVASFSGDIHMVPHHLALPGLVDHVQGLSLESIMQAIYGGVKHAYETKERPYSEIDLEKLGVYEIGYYLQFRMLEIMYIGQLMGINTFDQPAVELYKSQTRELLKMRKALQ
jgi:glucose-6-phosphate isomerase